MAITGIPDARRVAFCVSVASLVLKGGAASAANLQLKPYIELRETYTDNIFLTPEDRVDDFITRVSAGIDAMAKGPKLDLTLRYAANYLVPLEHGSDDLRHDLVGGFVWRPVDADLKIHGDAFINQAFYDRGGALGFNPGDSLSRELRTLRNFNGGIAYQTHRDDLQFSANYTAGYLDTTLDKASVNPSFRVSDSFNQSGRVRLGNAFGALTLAAFSNYQGSNRRDSGIAAASDFHNWRSGVDAAWRINHAWSLVGSVSYVDSTGSLFASRTGIYVDGGFTYKPSDRTHFEIRYGRDRGHDRLNASLDHRFSRTIFLRANYLDEITTSQFLTDNLLSGISRDRLGRFVNADGAVLNDPYAIFALDNRILHVRDATAGVEMRGRRLTLGLDGAWMRHDYGTGSGTQDNRKSVSVRADYRTSPHGTLSGYATYMRASFGDLAFRDRTLTGGVTYALSLSEHLNASLSATHSGRRSDASGRGLKENSVSLLLRAQF